MSLLRELLLLVPSIVALAACSPAANDADPPCPAPVLPPTVAEATITRLDGFELGPSGSAARLGGNLDGVCTQSGKTQTRSCRSTFAANDVNGVDNNFAATLGAYLPVIFHDPKVDTAGFSYLETRGDGTATFTIGSVDGARIYVPLVDVRLGALEGDGSRVVFGIVPAQAFADSLVKHSDRLLLAGTCADAEVDRTLVGLATGPADIRLDGKVDSNAPCDGISFAMRYRGAVVDAAPVIPRDCARAPAPTTMPEPEPPATVLH